MILVVLLAAAVPYLPFLALPFISDSYLQIYLGRQYGPISHWGDLSRDILYRSRATSLVFTFLVDDWAGANPVFHRLGSIFVHAANCLLVAGLGAWPRIGWRVSIPAAIYFGLSEAHQEAVIWTAALPELLVFFFSLLAIMAWIRALRVRGGAWLGASVLFYGLALLSKESAVIVPVVAACIWRWERRDWRLPAVALAAMSVAAAGYALAIFAASATHLHLNDGTFSFQAPFLVVITKSLARLLFPWGWLALAILAAQHKLGEGRLGQRPLVALCGIWMVIALLPYAFLTYMDRVPSRHTYLASLGLSLLVGAGFVAIRFSGGRWNRPAAALFALLLSVQSVFYLWTKKLDQYQARAEVTERFLRFAAESDFARHPAAKPAAMSILVMCAPVGFEALRYAAHVRLGMPTHLVIGAETPSRSARLYCDPSRP